MAERIDYVVIGGGMAGLMAGAVLATSRRKVAVFERHGKLGGYAQYFGHDPTYDSATHLIGGCGPGGWTRTALAEVGVLDRVELLPLDPVYRAVFPRHEYLAAADPERFRQELSTLWPAEADGIRRFFEEVEAIGRESLTLVDGPPAGGILARHHDRTLSDFLDDYTRDEELRAALSALWLYGGLPPERLSAIHYAMLWHSFHNQGSAAVRGGVKVLTGALAEVITERGGLVETRAPVARIVRQRGRVTGVRLEDGREFETEGVISTASPHDTFEELLAAEGQTPAGYPPLRGFVTSISTMQVHVLYDGELQTPARSTILHQTYDLERAYAELQRSEGCPALVGTVLDFGDPGRVPEGQHMLSLFTLSPYSRSDNWNVPFDLRRTKAYRTLPEYLALKESLASGLLQCAERIFPGLAEHTTVQRVATPITMERYTANTGGAAYGWANIPQQSGGNRPGPKTPFRNLYMAGHWTFPGGSVAAAVTSGRIAAKVALAEH